MLTCTTEDTIKDGNHNDTGWICRSQHCNDQNHARETTKDDSVEWTPDITNKIGNNTTELCKDHDQR